MSKFNVGDTVVRKVGLDNNPLRAALGNGPYIVTAVSEGARWFCINNWDDGGIDPYPWYDNNFERVDEHDDPLPPAPSYVYYPDMYELITGKRAVGDTNGLTVRVSPFTAGALSLQVDGSKWTRIDADAALQLAHDLRRMAMELKRKEKM